MTATQPVLESWAVHPIGKVARALIAVGGLIVAFLLMMVSTMVGGQAWVMVLIAAGLAATSARAARYPTKARLAILLLNLLAIPLFGAFI